jgi:hypothetical protein
MRGYLSHLDMAYPGGGSMRIFDLKNVADLSDDLLAWVWVQVCVYPDLDSGMLARRVWAELDSRFNRSMQP